MREPCGFCDGTGKEWICPSCPDQCPGCEEITCRFCGGKGYEEVA